MKIGKNVIINKNEIETDKNSVLESWSNIELIEENKDRKGLREPQIGAIYGLLSHRTISSSDATIVLPTGVGKTETMIGVILKKQCNNILIIVPSSGLRTQIAEKISCLGIFKELELVEKSVKKPIIGKIEHIIQTIEDVEELYKTCNILIATMNVVNRIDAKIKEKLYEKTDYLFIDEAHHIAAKTWMNFKKSFDDTKIVQFTATPYRNDGKSIDGKLIYNYPLKKAQEYGYIKRIKFIPICENSIANKDERIAKKAINVLEEDFKKNRNFRLMVRGKTKQRARELFELYRGFNKFKTSLLLSDFSKTKKEKIINDFKNGTIKILVCVDMLKEGFDLPELKITALHDPHKSLGVTIQFIGRFIRRSSEAEEARIIANTDDEKMNNEIKELYKQDSDWNTLIINKSEDLINEEIEKHKFSEEFTDIEIDEKIFSVNFLKIPMSLRVYKTVSKKLNIIKLKKNIKKESKFNKKGVEEKNSIQSYLLKKLKNCDYNYDLVINDDNSGEIADIVTIKNSNNIEIELYHCKFSSKDYIGARVTDLYEVCGQAQKSNRWKYKNELMISELIRRNKKKPDRFEKGEINDLEKIQDEMKSKKTFLKIFIVQPGLSKSKINEKIRSLLVNTQHYLKENNGIPFKVICSE
jgi:superfamily II DNA or RNA helicase